MTASRFLMIARRFRGPPESGNGGYTCGMLAAEAAKPVEVRLMRPPPLDRPLEIREEPAESRLLVMDGDAKIRIPSPRPRPGPQTKHPGYVCSRKPS